MISQQRYNELRTYAANIPGMTVAIALMSDQCIVSLDNQEVFKGNDRDTYDWIRKQVIEANTTKITPSNGQPEVDCYGQTRWDSNYSAVFDDENLDDIMDGGSIDGCDGETETAPTWQQVVDGVADYAKACGTELVEISAC